MHYPPLSVGKMGPALPSLGQIFNTTSPIWVRCSNSKTRGDVKLRMLDNLSTGTPDWSGTSLWMNYRIRGVSALQTPQRGRPVVVLRRKASYDP
mmetsp:Transcript_76739/g.204939  ORF Transcript_76739/g.204939 Transcript_76739/m.204939 type:complete len:94 (+) Transcript_76739:1993-2274(+)